MAALNFKRVVIIDVELGEIREGRVRCLNDMQLIVGGNIERGHTLENGDEVYVNEEGLFIDGLNAFYIKGSYQPFFGSAYIIGSVTSTGNNRASKSTISEIKEMVRFMKCPG